MVIRSWTFYDELAIYLLWKECEMLQPCVVKIIYIWIHLKILVIVSLRVRQLLKGSTLMLIFLFVNFTPWLLLVDKPSLYKRCKWNFEIKCVWFLFSYIGQDTDWTLANGSLNSELFYSDKIHLTDNVNSKFSKSLSKSIEDFYETGNVNRYQLTKSYKKAVSSVLSNADFPSLSTVSKLHSTSINAFSDRHIPDTLIQLLHCDTFFEDCSPYI